MLHLKNIMNSECPPEKMISPTIVDLNFNVKEVLVEDYNGEKVTMFEYETYRFEDFVEYLVWQNNSLEKDIKSLMLVVNDIAKKVGV